MNGKPASKLLLVVLCAVLTLVGCGGGSGGGAVSTSSGAASAAPTTGGGEESIERFGREAAGSERKAIIAAFRGYMTALAAKDYPTACSGLAASARRGLAAFASSTRRHRSCAAILPQLLAPAATSTARGQAASRIARTRVRGSRGFVVFHAAGARLFQMPMAREAGGWRVGLIVASVLVPSRATLEQ